VTILRLMDSRISKRNGESVKQVIYQEKTQLSHEAEVKMPDVSKIVEKENVKDIILQFTDISGALHSLWVPAQLFSRIADEGVHFDGSSVAMVDISESDLKLIPELNTFRILPQSLFPQRVAKVTCDLYEPESDKPFKLSPRFILKKLMKDSMKSLGPSVNYNACSEIEYFVFRKDESGNIKTIDEGGYLESPPTDAGADLRLELWVSLLRNTTMNAHLGSQN
jgi:glutamine synthetase